MTATISSSSPFYQNIFAKTASIVIITSTLSGLPAFNITGPKLIQPNMINSPTISKTQHLPGEAKTLREMRAMKIKALRGKYKNALTPSNDFARRKQLEIEIEK